MKMAIATSASPNLISAGYEMTQPLIASGYQSKPNKGKTMAKATYARGYCRASALSDRMIMVRHSAHDTRADIGKAATECNYAAGNWNKSRLVSLGSLATKAGPHLRVTFYAIVPKG